MTLHELNPPSGLEEHPKLGRAYHQMSQLLAELRTRELSPEVISGINSELEAIHAETGSEKKQRLQLKKSQSRILKLIEKDHKLVTKNHYRNLWTALGMSAFGIPLGIAFGASLGNMAYLGIGLPIGLAIGIAVGTHMDQKAKEEGRQLDVELNS
jgi:zinc transporter ZupT